MKFTSLREHLQAAKAQSDGAALFPCYVVYGDDAWLRQTAVGMFRGLLDPDYDSFNFTRVSVVDGADVIVDTLNTYPVFDELRVVVVPDVSDKLSDADKETFAAYVAHPNPAAVFVVVCEEGAEKSLGFKAEKVDCNKLDEDSVAQMVTNMLAQTPARRMGGAALHELYTRTRGDMSRVVCEIAKLKAYCDDEITREAVCEMTTPDLDVQIFELSEAVSGKRAEKSLTVLDSFFKDGVRPMTVLNLLYGHYRKMLHVELQKGMPDNELAALLGVKTGALYHLRRVSGSYSQVRLKKCVDYIHELQFSVLTGKRNETSALHEAVLTLLNI